MANRIGYTLRLAVLLATTAKAQDPAYAIKHAQPAVVSTHRQSRTRRGRSSPSSARSTMRVPLRDLQFVWGPQLLRAASEASLNVAGRTLCRIADVCTGHPLPYRRSAAAGGPESKWPWRMTVTAQMIYIDSAKLRSRGQSTQVVVRSCTTGTRRIRGPRPAFQASLRVLRPWQPIEPLPGTPP